MVRGVAIWLCWLSWMAACAQATPGLDSGPSDSADSSLGGDSANGDGGHTNTDAAPGADACPCLAGLCCDGCTYLPDTTVCGDTAYDVRYQCAGTECGANAEYQEQYQYCDGVSAQCGVENLVWNDWEVLEDCDTNALCETDATNAWCTTCTNGCSGDSCICDQGSNVAPSGVATITEGSIDQVMYGPHKMIDGQFEASCGWCWFYAPASPTPWMQLSWPSPQQLWGFSVDTVSQSSAPCDYTSARTLAGGTVQWWDGGNWVTDGNVSGQTNDWAYQFSAPITTTAIRLYNAYSSPSDNPVVFEWQVFACN